MTYLINKKLTTEQAKTIAETIKDDIVDGNIHLPDCKCFKIFIVFIKYK